MKRKTYTKKQIENAIAYWTKELKLMNESYNAVIDALVDEFGHDMVFSKRNTYKLTNKDLHKIFSILNTHLFENKLNGIKIEYWPEDKVVDTLNDYAIRSDVFDEHLKKAPCYGVHTAVCKDVKDTDGNIVDVNIYDDIIMMNSDYLQECIFIFAIASICHEMIHAYDRFTQQYHDNALEASKTKKKKDSHKDDAFQDKMKEANAFGINVVERYGNDQSYVDANKNARFKLYNVFGEDEIGNDNVIVAQNDNEIVMRTKGSNKFFICEFD